MKIIVFEGSDCTGKTTLAKMLAEKIGWNYLKFPTDGINGKRASQMLNDKHMFDPFIYQTYQHIDKKCTVGRLVDGNYVFDRFKLSEIVYGYANGLSEKQIMDLADNIPDPDITFVITGKSYGLDKDIFGNVEYQEKIKELFLREAKKAGGRVEIINNEKPIESVLNEIIGKLGGIV